MFSYLAFLNRKLSTFWQTYCFLHQLHAKGYIKYLSSQSNVCFFSFCSYCVCVSSNVYQSLCIIKFVSYKNVFKYFTKSFGAFTWSKFSFLFPTFCFIWYAFACWMYKNNNINIYLHANWKRRIVNTLASSSHPEVFLRKSVLKICNKFTGEHPGRSVISIKLLLQLYWNHTSAWMFFCKFATYFQNTFS